MAEPRNTINVPVAGSNRFEQDVVMAISRLKASVMSPDSSPSFANLSLTDLDASKLSGTDADKSFQSINVGNSITLTGTTLDTIQDIRATASPTFADLTLSNPANIYALSHDSFAYFVADEHVAHSGVSVLAGDGMSGGGAITASVTLTNADRGSVAVTSHENTYAHGDLHSPVTLGTANGLSLNVQELSLPTTASPTFAGLTIYTGDVDVTEKTTGTMSATGFALACLKGKMVLSAVTDFEVTDRMLVSKEAATSWTFLGYKAGDACTGNYNTFIGYECGAKVTTGSGNAALGQWSCGALSALEMTGTNNLCFGTNSGQVLSTGSNNILLGINCARSLTTGSTNVLIGAECGRTGGTTFTGNVRIGHEAGRYDTNSNRLIIDNQNRTNAAGELANALIYGVFDAAAANQWVRVNGKLGAGISPLEDIHAADTVRADTAFNLNGTDGITVTDTVITALRDNAGTLQHKSKTITFTGGIRTATGAESGWTDVPSA